LDPSAILANSGAFIATNSRNFSHGFRESFIVWSKQFELSLELPASELFKVNNAGSNTLNDSAILANSGDFIATNSRNFSHCFGESFIVWSKQLELSLGFPGSELFKVNTAQSGNEGGFLVGLISGIAIGCVAVCLLAIAILFLLRLRQTDASDVVYETGYEADGKVASGDHLDFNEEEVVSFADTPVIFEKDSWMHGHVFSRPDAFVDFSAEEVFM
jgi:hypothetical protein